LNDDEKLWIPHECVEMCKWKGNLIPYDIKTDKECVTIPGNIIPNTLMHVLQRSLLLKDENKTRRILRVWIAKENKNENT